MSAAEPRFQITQAKGFHLRFDNGWTVSVQWGRYNYCSNYRLRGADEDYGADTAEIAAWDSGGEWWAFEDDQVKGYLSPDEVLAFMQEIASQPVKVQS